jgi:hypothetical protein
VSRSALPPPSSKRMRTSLLHHNVILCLVFAFASLSVHAQSTTTLRGSVVDDQTHRGIARVLVELNGNEPGQLTDNDGHFSFPNIPVGTVTVRYRRPGYFDPLTGALDASRSLPLATADAGQASGQILALEQVSAVRGNVTVPDGDSASGVRVDLYAARVSDGWRLWRIERSINVQAHGSFYFGNLEPGSYAVHAEGSVDPVPYGTSPGLRSGYAPVFAPSAPDLASATIVVLRSGQTAEIDPELSRVTYYPVAIHLAGESSGYGAQITGNGFTHWSASYSHDEEALTTELPSGSYIAHVGGFNRFGSNGRSGRGELSFQVHDAPATNLSITLNEPAPIALDTQVSDDTSASAPGAQTATVSSTPRLILLLFTPTDAPSEEPLMGFVRHDTQTGAQTLQSNLGPGTYWVSATTIGGYLASLSSGDTNLFTQPLTVDPASPPAISAVLRSDTASIAVTLDGSLAAQPCVVQLLPLSPGGRAESHDDENGSTSVNFTGLAPGDYLLLATPTRGNIAYREPGVLQQLTGQHVSVAAGATGQVTLNALSPPPAGAMEPR